MKTTVPSYLQDPTLPLTITVIGAGGSGSMFLQHLARVVYAYKALRNKTVVVVVVDGDKISDTNIGRQAYAPNEKGYFKSEIIVSRINRFYGFTWLSIPEYFEYKEFNNQTFLKYSSNFIISAVDNVDTRRQIQEFFLKSSGIENNPEYKSHFWLDMGNSKTTGNVLVSSYELEWPDIFEHGNALQEKSDEPACSLAMALNQQDMFINSQCSLIAVKWLWECMTLKEIDWRGCFVNLDTFAIRKIKTVKAHAEKEATQIKPQTKSDKRKSGVNKTKPATARKRKLANSVSKGR